MTDARGRRGLAHEMPFGAQLLETGGVCFRAWAPGVLGAELLLLGRDGERRVPMHAQRPGWHQVTVPEASAGARYKFILHTKEGTDWTVPDPASRFNPDGVHAESIVVDPRAYGWRETSWCGRPWTDAVTYELHIGTFTPPGTYRAAAERLPELAGLGITALQIMPLAAFPGMRNWGYDGVLPFAPAACYGTPNELKAFIDAAHGSGLMVLLDVVYNHFGPDGNYLHVYCPEFFNPAHRTPWGAAINFDGPMSRTVRDFFLHNALYWVTEYCFDGLRLDAVHAIHDASRLDIVSEIAQALREGPGIDRHVHLVLENNRNQAHYLERDTSGRPRLATAQWDDDVHHALHALLSGESDGYYADYAQAPLARLGRALAEGFAYQGEHSAFRGKPRGSRCAHLPPDAFVGFLQNHDVIGNRAFGGRIDSFAEPRLLRAAYACVLLTPLVPMLFMGEEYAASTPFLFFCDFGPELAEAVAAGRRREFQRFAAFGADEVVARIPDPNDPSTFAASKLDWSERTRPAHRERLALVRELLALRGRCLSPYSAKMTHGGRYRIEGCVLRLSWDLGDETAWRVLAHFGRESVETHAEPFLDVVFSSGIEEAPGRRMRLEPGAVRVTRDRK